MQVSGHLRFFIGTYTDAPSQSQGIAQISLNPQTGELTLLDDFYPLRNPSYLKQTRQALYSFSEVAQQDGAQLVCMQRGINHALPILGDYPCHLDVCENNQYLAVANYGSGDVNVFALGDDGVPRALVTTLFEEGKGPNLDRQASPHAHQVVFQRTEKVLVSVDLGSDAIRFYHIEQNQFLLQQTLALTPGSGPRHLVFNRAEDKAYVVCELSETLVVLTKTDAGWQVSQLSDLIPNGEKGEAASAIKLSQDERFIYVSCRQQNVLSCFDVSQPTAQWLGLTDCGGGFPRDFTISACGEWVVVANQHSNNLTSFRRDLKTGALVATGYQCQVGAPVCVIEQKND